MYHFWYIGLYKKAKAFSSFVKKGAQCTIFGTLGYVRKLKRSAVL